MLIIKSANVPVFKTSERELLKLFSYSIKKSFECITCMEQPEVIFVSDFTSRPKHLNLSVDRVSPVIPQNSLQ